MKKLLLLLAVVGIVFFASCEKEPLGKEPETEQPEKKPEESLAGTTWKFRTEDDCGWVEQTLYFTSTHAIFALTNDADNNMNFAGTYTYDSPEIIIYCDRLTLTGSAQTEHTWIFPYEIRHIGTVEGQTMTVYLYRTLDTVEIVTFQKQ